MTKQDKIDHASKLGDEIRQALVEAVTNDGTVHMNWQSLDDDGGNPSGKEVISISISGRLRAIRKAFGIS